MKEIDKLIDGFVKGDLKNDAIHFFEFYNFKKTQEHSFKVAQEAKLLAHKFGVDEYSAVIAGYFHDISVVIPNSQKEKFALEVGIEVFNEETQFPLLLHQKLSKFMAATIFSCHTTLRANASPLDLVLFIADKIQWDQEGNPPYIEDVKSKLNLSLEASALSYIQFLLSKNSNLKVAHPWLLEAYNDLLNKCST